MADKSGENLNFSPLHRMLLSLWVKNSPEIALSLTVFEIFTFFSFSAKIQDGRKKGVKIEIFPLCIGYSCTTLEVKNSPTVFEIFTLFHFLQKSKMAAKSSENLNFPP